MVCFSCVFCTDGYIIVHPLYISFLFEETTQPDAFSLAFCTLSLSGWSYAAHLILDLNCDLCYQILGCNNTKVSTMSSVHVECLIILCLTARRCLWWNKVEALQTLHLCSMLYNIYTYICQYFIMQWALNVCLLFTLVQWFIQRLIE